MAERRSDAIGVLQQKSAFWKRRLVYRGFQRKPFMLSLLCWPRFVLSVAGRGSLHEVEPSHGSSTCGPEFHVLDPAPHAGPLSCFFDDFANCGLTWLFAE